MSDCIGDDVRECCMVFDEAGNAFDAFPWTPEELIEAAKRCAGRITVASPVDVWVTSSLSVRELEERA